jgi:hypothetical protein
MDFRRDDFSLANEALWSGSFMLSMADWMSTTRPQNHTASPRPHIEGLIAGDAGFHLRARHARSRWTSAVAPEQYRFHPSSSSLLSASKSSG